MSDELEFRCFIGGLAWSTSDRGLKDAFAKFGHLVEAKVVPSEFAFIKVVLYIAVIACCCTNNPPTPTTPLGSFILTRESNKSAGLYFCDAR